MKIKVEKILWDTDGEEVGLPENLTVEIPNSLFIGKDALIFNDIVEEFVSDEISNISGYCHFGFSKTTIVSI